VTGVKVAPWRRSPWKQWALRAAIVAGLVGALLAPGLDGALPQPWLLGVGAVLALGAATEPEHDAATAACCWVLIVWVVTDPDHIGPAAVLAAGGLVLAHVAAALTAYGPTRMSPDRRLVLLWLRRGALVLVPSALVAVVGSVLPAPSGTAGVWLWVVGAVLVAGLAAGVSLVHSAGS
jgi:hypothetical protein